MLYQATTRWRPVGGGVTVKIHRQTAAPIFNPDGQYNAIQQRYESEPGNIESDFQQQQQHQSQFIVLNTRVNAKKKSCWLLDCCCCCCCCCGVLHKWVWQRWINSNHSARKRKEWHSEWWRIRGKEKEGEESQIRRARVGGSSWRGGHIWETLEGKLEGNTRKRECVYWKRTRACWKRVRANEVSVLNVFNFRRQRYWTKDQFEFC